MSAQHLIFPFFHSNSTRFFGMPLHFYVGKMSEKFDVTDNGILCTASFDVVSL